MAEEQDQGESAAFDENPPVDPSEPQVGNSKARFFVPGDELKDSSEEEASSERDENEEGES
jgi:hypothetical protein